MSYSHISKIILLALALVWGLPLIVGAQSPPIQLQQLEIELWPEFDRPETLVIYRAELAPDTPLPAQLTFQLPGYLDKLFVVAVERDGVLVEVKPEGYELKREGDAWQLTLDTPSPRVQFEYYDPQILTHQGQQRQLKFNFTAPYATQTTMFRVQQPAGATNFVTIPAAAAAFTGGDGLKYHTLEAAGLQANDSFELTASYSKTGDTLSAQSAAPGPPGPSADPAVIAPTPPIDSSAMLAYVLMGVGVLLLLGVAGYWAWARRGQTAPAVSTPRQRQPKAKSASPTAANSGGSFCYRCGAPLRDDANFCHICGAERRKL
jgi:hypothetical protein